MKIATYNINGINGRLPVLLRWLSKAKPDVVCLQELKAETARFPERALLEAGYKAIWKGEKSWNGVAILSKDTIKELRNDLPAEDDSFTHSRYIEGFTFGMVIGCLYLPNGNPYPGPKFEYKLRWFKRLADHGQTLMNTGLPVMLAGDYNVMPTELDTYKPEKYLDNALFRTEIREAYQDLLSQGWTDGIRKLYPDERIYTFWDYLRNAYGRDAGLRLDHFLLNPALAGRLISAGVDKYVRGWEKSSDHAPVWIELADPVQAGVALSEAANKLKPANDLERLKDQWFNMPEHVRALLDAAPEAELPVSIKPMKATQVSQPFHDPGWVYEIKWDGYRALAMVEKGEAQLMSRRNLLFDQFEPINKLLAAWGMDVVLDGEIVTIDEIGMADFTALLNWRTEPQLKLVYYVFDILWFQGKLLTGFTLLQRREILASVLPTGDGLVRISHLFDVDGVAFYESAKRMKLEGIIAKDSGSVYSGDTRSRDWLKVKAKLRQEVVLAGFTRSEDSVKSFSALIVGVYADSGILRYIGKVGTGFSDGEQKDLLSRFASLETERCPFDVVPDVDEPSRFRPRRLGVKPTWLLPELVCEIEFAEITTDGKLRQASFKGLREDKDPKEVVLETADATEEILGDLSSQTTEELSTRADRKTPNSQAMADKKHKGVKYKMPNKLLIESKGEVAERIVDGHTIKFTNLNKLYWPQDCISKRDLFNYYDKIAPYMVPYLLDRPMSLNRFPGGIHGQSFYQKNVSETAPDWAHTMPHTNEKGERKEYLVGYDKATLLWMATLGCIEMNPWFSRVSSPDNPDYCVIDLDPDKNTFEQVIEAAQVTKSVLQAMGLPCYVKTSGSTGIHIYVPLGAKYTYDQSQLFAQVVVKLVHRELPSYTTLERMISNRKGKMYLDFLQNRPGATIAGVYSLRPKPGATVSMPLYWDEVKPGLTMRDFTIHNAPDRLREIGDLFTGVLGEGIDMIAAIDKARDTFG
ncbi:DNA ligase D [Pedobacter gandavensis]|uniref:DNA ligase D n=1 Tax=Pedobacter gandavensis TaxID=2679963 RepID=UPI002478AF47|nr:DNA ligase D [Pedobacter gandavensis]WGQ10690.1 DNA ligase D [Pedobacter gandavensis]